jgi:hypothetical protein
VPFVRKINKRSKELADNILKLDLNNTEEKNKLLEKCKKFWFRGYEENISVWWCEDTQISNITITCAIANAVPGKNTIDDPAYAIIMSDSEANEWGIIKTLGNSCLIEYNDRHFEIPCNGDEQLFSLAQAWAPRISNTSKSDTSKSFIEIPQIALRNSILDYIRQKRKIALGICETQIKAMFPGE